MRHFIPVALLMYVSLLTCRAAGGTIVHVPADEPTIQAGINSAGPGGEVIVAPGRYVENPVIVGGGLTVRSSNPDDPAVVAATVIDGGGTGTALLTLFVSGEMLVDGLTLTNGQALDGGGVSVGTSTIQFRNCVFEHNTATQSGGGMLAQSSHVTIDSCTFRSNAAGSGGGIAIRGGTLTVIGGLFEQNAANDLLAGSGGAIDVTQGTIVTIDGTRFSANEANSTGAAISHADSADITATDCLFEGNRGTSATFNSRGGAVGEPPVNGDLARFSATNCDFIDNSAGFTGAAITSGILNLDQCRFFDNMCQQGGTYCSTVRSNTSSRITRCQFYGNDTPRAVSLTETVVDSCVFVGNSGRALWCNSGESTNCTFIDNAITIMGNDLATMRNMVSIGHQLAIAPFDGEESPLPVVTDSLFTTDPQFVRLPDAGPDETWGTADDDYGDLRPRNPALIDTGNTAALPPDLTDLDADGDTTEPIPFDITGKPRVIGGTVDIGAIEISCRGDCSPPGGNGFVNIDDLLAVIDAFTTQDPACDISPDNGDGTFGNGTINIDDLLTVVDRFGPCR